MRETESQLAISCHDSQTLHKKRDLEKYISKWHNIHQIPPSVLRESCGRRGRKIERVRGDRGMPWEQGTLNQLSKAQKNSQRLKQQAEGRHRSQRGPLHAYYSFHVSTFLGLLSVWTNESLILVHCLRPLFLSLACLIQLQCDGFWFILFYFVLLCFVVAS